MYAVLVKGSIYQAGEGSSIPAEVLQRLKEDGLEHTIVVQENRTLEDIIQHAIRPIMLHKTIMEARATAGKETSENGSNVIMFMCNPLSILRYIYQVSFEYGDHQLPEDISQAVLSWFDICCATLVSSDEHDLEAVALETHKNTIKWQQALLQAINDPSFKIELEPFVKSDDGLDEGEPTASVAGFEVKPDESDHGEAEVDHNPLDSSNTVHDRRTGHHHPTRDNHHHDHDRRHSDMNLYLSGADATGNDSQNSVD